MAGLEKKKTAIKGEGAEEETVKRSSTTLEEGEGGSRRPEEEARGRKMKGGVKEGKKFLLKGCRGRQGKMTRGGKKDLRKKGRRET